MHPVHPVRRSVSAAWPAFCVPVPAVFRSAHPARLASAAARVAAAIAAAARSVRPFRAAVPVRVSGLTSEFPPVFRPSALISVQFHVSGTFVDAKKPTQAKIRLRRLDY